MAKKTKSKIIEWDGTPVTEPGIYKGISLELYHSAELFDGVPAISSSGLRTIANFSPAHYWAESPYNPDRVEPVDKPHFVLGRALHHLTAGEPGFFERWFALQPDTYTDDKTGEVKKWNGNANVCKAWVAAQNGRTILKEKQVEQLRGMAISLGNHPLVRQGALSGNIEHSYFWRDKETGIWLKWRPDATPVDSADFVDLKTTSDVRWFKLQRTIEDFGYHQQGALGRVACRDLIGREMNSFALLFIEKERPPHDCRLVQLKDNDLELGERQNRAALHTFWKCWKAKHWPGMSEADVEFVELNSKTQERIDQDLRARNF